MIDAFIDEPMFYIAIILGKKDQTPLDIAVQMNSPKLVEIMLNALNKVPTIYKISNAVNRLFPQLFELKIKSFD